MTPNPSQHIRLPLQTIEERYHGSWPQSPRTPLGPLDTNRQPVNPPSQFPRFPAVPNHLPGAVLPDAELTIPTANAPPLLPAVRTPPATNYSSIAVKVAQKSPLFNLPVNVRLAIYRMGMELPSNICIKRRPFAAEPNLLFTCKQIREEGQLLFWSENTFQGRDAVYVCFNRTRAPQVLYQRRLSVLLKWLHRIGKEKTKLIKRLIVDYDEDCQFNDHPSYQSNWPCTAQDVMKHKKLDLEAAAKYSAIKILRGLLFHGVELDAVKPVFILMDRDGESDQFYALWKLAMEDVVGLLKAPQ